MTQPTTGFLVPTVAANCLTIAAASAALRESGICTIGASPAASIIWTHVTGSIAVSQPLAAQVMRLLGSAGSASVSAIRA